MTYWSMTDGHLISVVPILFFLLIFCLGRSSKGSVASRLDLLSSSNFWLRNICFCTLNSTLLELRKQTISRQNPVNYFSQKNIKHNSSLKKTLKPVAMKGTVLPHNRNQMSFSYRLKSQQSGRSKNKLLSNLKKGTDGQY